MKLSDKIKFEVFIAFIHSRITGKASDPDGMNEKTIKSEHITTEIEEAFNLLKNKLNKISNVDIVNHKIAHSPSKLISDMYYNNYMKLFKRMDDLIKKDDEIIESIIGLNMLYWYLENKNLIEDIDKGELNSILELFKNHSEENRGLVSKMIRVSYAINGEYFKKAKK